MRNHARRAAHALIEVLFARRRFKMLLRATMQELDLRMQALASATDFFSTIVRPVVVKAPFGCSMLVVAPHQDDEAIGCGGALALQRRSGNHAAVMVLQDGADEHAEVGMAREELRDLRNAESRAAARAIDIEPPICLGLQDLRANADDAVRELQSLIEGRRVDAIFTPFVLDGHRDHRACNYIVARALADAHRDIRVLEYEVWSQCIPNVLTIIDEVIDKKMEMLACFAFANRAIDYAHATKGLNMFHSRLLPAGRALYVERFFELPRREFIALVRQVEVAERREADP
jgi:LmbE family N-acetylglucosaminyl deacetylase